MREVAGEGVTSQISAVLPLGGICGSSTGVAQVSMLYLAVESELFVHLLYYLYKQNGQHNQSELIKWLLLYFR
jgi:uncharacterized membrane protein YtjA (UPF0391 family)